MSLFQYMSPFQYLALFVVVGLFVLSISAAVRGWATRREGVTWALVWLAATFAIVRPDATAEVAKALGIGRGADLVLYCAVVLMMVGFLMIYVRLRQLRRELTQIVRHMALREARTNPHEPGETSS